jgi:hypothetical protein
VKTSIKYGLLNALLGLVIGFYVAMSAIGKGDFGIMIAAPIAAFTVGVLLWKLIVDKL